MTIEQVLRDKVWEVGKTRKNGYAGISAIVMHPDTYILLKRIYVDDIYFHHNNIDKEGTTVNYFGIPIYRSYDIEPNKFKVG